MWGSHGLMSLLKYYISTKVITCMKYIAFVLAEADTDQPEVELQPGIALLGPVDEMFFDTYDRFVPVNEPSLDNCFISTVRGSVIFLAMNSFTYIGFDNVLGIELQLIISVIASELWCNNTFQDNNAGCSCYVHPHNWKGMEPFSSLNYLLSICQFLHWMHWMFVQTKEYTKYNIVNVNLKRNNRMILICKSGHVSRMILMLQVWTNWEVGVNQLV